MKKRCFLLALLIAGFNIFAQTSITLKPGLYLSIEDFKANRPSYLITELPDLEGKLEENNDEYICVESVFYSDSTKFISAMPAKKIWGFCTGDEVYVSVPDSIWSIGDFFKGATGKEIKEDKLLDFKKPEWIDKTACFYHVRELGTLCYIPKPIKRNNYPRDFENTLLGDESPRDDEQQSMDKPTLKKHDYEMPRVMPKSSIQYFHAFIDMPTGAIYNLSYENIAPLIQQRDLDLYAEWHKKKDAKKLYYFYLTQFNKKHPLQFVER
jgi:hypothetical protein